MLACTKTGRKALACCQLLLENGGSSLLGDKNKDGWNAIHVAVREGDPSIVKLLLEADPDSKQVSMRSNNGRTPLHTAGEKHWRTYLSLKLLWFKKNCAVHYF